MDLMFSLTVRRIAGYRNELGDYYSNRTFCHISMGDFQLKPIYLSQKPNNLSLL